jgi:hypothetical protein
VSVYRRIHMLMCVTGERACSPSVTAGKWWPLNGTKGLLPNMNNFDNKQGQLKVEQPKNYCSINRQIQ